MAVSPDTSMVPVISRRGLAEPVVKAAQFSPWTATLSGANRSMLTLLGELAMRGRGYGFFLRHGELSQCAEALGAHIGIAYPRPIPPCTKIGRFITLLTAFSVFVKQHGIGVLHCHSAAGLRFAWPLARLARLPLVVHQRDNYQNDAFHRGLHRADHIIAISEWVRSTLPDRLLSRTTVIANAVEPTTVGGWRARYGNAPLRIGIAGRCIPDKGFDIFLESLEHVRDVPPFEAHVWGVQPVKGHESYFDSITKGIERLRSKPSLVVQSEPFRPDVATFYQTVDVVVIPSRFAEPFGRVAIEAMAAGCVVIAANHGGLAEIIDGQHSGLLFEPGNARNLASQIQQLLNNPDSLRRLSERGREISLTRYSPAQHADAVQRVYQQLACSQR
jgi:glycosyltransferase involved in cell wall biosynthesis